MKQATNCFVMATGFDPPQTETLILAQPPPQRNIFSSFDLLFGIFMQKGFVSLPFVLL